MARTSKARVFRSTQTSPNAGTVRDLTTAFGTTANATTSAQYVAAGTITWKQWNPHSATATNQDPASVSVASGQGWRDTVGENAADQVRYAAGTWTVRVRLSKTGQTLATDITVRVTVIVYQVSSAGDHVAEIGRATTADTTLSTTTLSLSPSFTTGASIVFNAADKIQVECYVTPVVAGIPAAPTAAVNVNFVVDETSANSGASFTAQPTHDILYARSTADSSPASDALARALTANRGTADSAPASDVLTKTSTFPRSPADSAPAADSLARRHVGSRSIADSALASDSLARSTIQARGTADSAPAADSLARRTTQARGTADSAPASDALARSTIQARSTADSAPASDSLTRSFITARSLADSAPSSDALTRSTVQARSTSDSAPASDALTRFVFFPRATADTTGATDTVTRSTVQARPTADSATASDVLGRVLGAVRATSDSAPASDALARSVVVARALADVASAADALTRSLVQARSLADSAPASDALARSVIQARSTADVVSAMDLLTRMLVAFRGLADTAPASDVLAASKIMAREIADSAPASDSLARQLTNVRVTRDNIGPDPIDIVDFPTRVLAGVVRNNTGTPVAGATVKLMRQSDDRAVRVTTSAADGSYSFPRDRFDLETYYIISFVDGVPQTQGISERGLVPA